MVDRYDWALANIARQLTLHLSDEFEFDVLWGYGCEPETLLYLTKTHAAVHFMWRDVLTQIGRDWRRGSIEAAFGSWTAFVAECMARPVSFTVFDHLFLDPDNLDYARRLFIDLATSYTVSSWKLDRIYRDIPGYRAPDMVTPDGVDLNLFRPLRLERLEQVGQRPLKIGWVGNSVWGNDRIAYDSKGLHTILRPALELLKREGVAIEERFADREIRFIPHHRMARYYSEIDVLVCSSLVEGTPNPVLEAMACGVPVVTTDVGIVREALGPLQSRFILAERSVEAMAACIRNLVAQPSVLLELSGENLLAVKDWDWSLKAQNYRRFLSKLTRHRASFAL